MQTGKGTSLIDCAEAYQCRRYSVIRSLVSNSAICLVSGNAISWVKYDLVAWDISGPDLYEQHVPGTCLKPNNALARQTSTDSTSFQCPMPIDAALYKFCSQSQRPRFYPYHITTFPRLSLAHQDSNTFPLQFCVFKAPKEELGPWTPYSSHCVEVELELGEHVILFRGRQ